MIGYVLDGDCDHAIRLVGQNIAANKVALRMQDGSLAASRLRQDNSMIRETIHDLGRTEIFRLHHLFLSAVVNEGPPSTSRSFGTKPARRTRKQQH